MTSGPLTAAAENKASTTPSAKTCPGDNGGITLPAGFCATVFADNIGHARHLVVAPNGVVYVNTWSGTYYGNDTPPPGGFLVALQDINGDGQADVTARFGDTIEHGDHGGTGIALYKGALYAEVNDRIVRYALPKDGITPTGEPETIVSGLPLTGDHPMHPFAIDANGNLFVDVASATNSCQSQNRMPNVPGDKPCTELETRGGIWRYDANKTGQTFSPAERYATGIRNADGITIDQSGLGLYAAQQGRDELYENWPKLYNENQGANLPAEELLQVKQGDDFGWPECYFDNVQQKLVLAPEYGGDGGKTVGVCAEKKEPVAFFPAHWAPNDLMLYNGTQFPTAYQGRRLHRLPRLVEPRAVAARRLQRRVSAARQRQGVGEICRLRRRFRRRSSGSGPSRAPAVRGGHRARRLALYCRRPAWAHLAGDLPRREDGRH